ncbi:type I-E CRISPR-associated protein Cas7/Cse4/CasC [Levilactobacillus zymae]|uniref:Type I-E CRISPR-associated protein Cas7/Cse4/CasC n=1 Tax=Levilactobacillus zymae TaxID=267363 RepID=A0ABQ0X3T3_9LACO|nr:type I-E CRISPR-associated protein Cas7/Cse4/CasC [Levilactobacillus zymae]QFR60572.1 type I-E CRISPR-associated protein Cas7/Cse4/CasC [Levilactobacillus zymae]GEO72957.1 type I-E CRISPR-associated protein Cas7/Cse4/CasC [Levilactobacillus zymae]
MTNNLYIDINVLQTLPPSNINRDDIGSPKKAQYGGVTRARVSSQSWKRAVRKAFKAEKLEVATRTKEVAKLLAEQLKMVQAELSQEDAMKQALQILKTVGIKMDKKDKQKTATLLMVSPGQLNKIVQYITQHGLEDKETEKEIKNILKGNQSLDLALFGRMVADDPSLNVEGSTQVAHAISTHAIEPEFDYFTALDDEHLDDAGAAMIGSTEFNSSTLYRYANVNMRELAQNLGAEDAIKGAVTFIKDFLLAMPSGKQNSFANRTRPNYVMVTLRADTPLSLVSAFEEPVESDNGYVEASIKALEEEYQATLKMGMMQPVGNYILSTRHSELTAKKGNQVMTDLPQLLDQVTQALTGAIKDEDTNA